MVAVLVSGVPGQFNLPKTLAIFRSILRKHGAPSQFWIKEMEDIRGTYMKTLKMEFQSITDAYAAAKILDGYKMAEADRPLTAIIDEGRRRPLSPYRRPSRDEFRDYGRRTYSPVRSRSPIMREASQLDMEIELLRKQRLIIEEERRLIMERKKLELVKELGPRAMRDYRPLEERHERRYRPERSPERRPRRSPPRPPLRPRARPDPRAQPAPPTRGKLPLFNLPCKLLLEQMHDCIEKYKKETGHEALLTKIMKNTLRKRLAVALEGKPIMAGAKIVQLYREKYPTSSDDTFVFQHVRELKSLHMPDGGKSSKPKAEEKEKQEEVNGKAESDTATQDDTNTVDVKTQQTTENEPMEEANTTTDQNNSMEEASTTEDQNNSMEEASTTENQNNSMEEASTTEEVNTVEDQTAEEPGSEGNEETRDEEKHEGSVDSNDALALLDSNEEEWEQGEHDWAEEKGEQVQEAQEEKEE